MTFRTTLMTIALMLAFGTLAAGTPFRGDQSLFTQYAARMHSGEVLYRDLWDVTNPGVFWFYQAAGTLFGFDENGIHFGEWLWFTTFVLTVQAVMVRRSGVPTLAPAFLIGGWYSCTATADPSHLTKAEGLVAFPLFVAIAGLQSRRRSVWLAAGVAAGVAVLFKFAFVLLVLAGVLPRVIALVRIRNWRLLVVFAIGAIIPPALAIAFFAWHDALPAVQEALVRAPREMLQHAVRADLARLMHGVRWCAETGTVLAVLALAGLLATPRWWCNSLLTGYIVMLPAALTVILVQRWSWWTYHFQLISLPLAVLASVTWPSAIASLSCRKWLWLLVPLAASPALHGASAALRLFTSSNLTEARHNAGAAYRIAAEDATGCPPDADRIFVAGDPLIYDFTRRPQATQMHGWSLEFFGPGQWRQLYADLQAHHPAAIFIDQSVHGDDQLIRKHAPELWQWIQLNYSTAAVTPHGQWYDHRP
jgi:hypothetical protein